MFENDAVMTAYSRIKNTIVQSPCLYSPWLSKITGARVHLKMENMQQTGSFKERGALNFLMARPEGQLTKVVAASAGNHAQAVALHAHRLGIRATIFMPIGTSNTKILQTERYHAEVKLVGNSYDEAYAFAQEYAEEQHAEYVHAYNDLDIIIGQGTVGLEINQQLGIPDFIFAPVGGGGLFAGIAQFFANQKNKIPTMVGVEASAFQSMAHALDKGTPFSLLGEKTIADGIAVRKVGTLTHEICDKLKPTMVSVDDDQIQRAIMLLMEKQKIVSEGAGAAATAGLLLGRFSDEIKDKNVVVIVSGGNIDLSLLSRLTGQELIKSGRLSRMSIVIKDTPGSLSRLLSSITRASGNIVDIHHERSFAILKWNEVLVDVTVETKDEIHEKEMKTLLIDEGYVIKALMGNRFVS